MTRRTFLAATAAAALPAAANDESAIRARIVPPKFPARDFDITKSGARPDGQMLCTSNIARAIEACAKAGGGRVIVPRGEFLTGAIRLKSGVNLHLEDGATLRFTTDTKAYPLAFTRWEGTECWNFSPFLYALDQSNLAITGSGTLDGSADAEHWWDWKTKAAKTDRPALQKMGEDGTPVDRRRFGEGHYLRPQFIQPYRCKNVLIEGVSIRRSPMWEIHPVLCRNVTVRDVKIDTHGPNNDGCDPESCADVLVERCEFSTGDDCIAIKSGRNADGRRLHTPCENLIIADCNMKDGHGGVSIGSEASGGVRNVFILNCRMSSPHLDRALRLKTNSYRGGFMENIVFRDITVGEVATDAIQIDFSYEEGEGGPFNPEVRDVEIRNVTCGKAADALNLRGYASAPIRNVRVTDCRFDHVRNPNIVEHVEGLVLRNVIINGKPVNS